MARVRATCEHVQDGDTFRTGKQNWIRLARVNAPAVTTMEGQKAKGILEGLILGRVITYEQVGTSYNRIVAEVWVGTTSVNDYMRSQGYK